jgi:hypothetical protein
VLTRRYRSSGSASQCGLKGRDDDGHAAAPQRFALRSHVCRA